MSIVILFFQVLNQLERDAKSSIRRVRLVNTRMEAITQRAPDLQNLELARIKPFGFGSKEFWPLLAYGFS